MAFPEQKPLAVVDPFAQLKSKLGQARWADESDDDDEPAPSVENRGRAGRKENVAKPVHRDLSVASSVASLRSTTKEINRRRNRGNRKGKQATPRVSEDLTKSFTAAEALGSLEPIPLTRSAASELALLLEGI